MACSDVDGNFNAGRLTPDGTTTSQPDPIMRILSPPDRTGRFTGRFDGDSATFTGQCTGNGRVSTITLTRTHNNGTTTEYSGLVFRRVPPPTDDPVFIRGRFERTTTAAVATTTGDWETEKPT